MAEHTIQTSDEANDSSWTTRIQLPLWPGLVFGIVAILVTLNVTTAGASVAVDTSRGSVGPVASATTTSFRRGDAEAPTTEEPVVAPSTGRAANDPITAPTTSPPTTQVAPSATSSMPPTASEAPPASGPGLPTWLNGVPGANEIDWIMRPGSSSCSGAEGAAWWPNGDYIHYLSGKLVDEEASSQVCISLGSPDLHDVALHEAGHYWQAHTIGILRIWNDYGKSFPINSQADYQRFTRAVLEPLADCAARSWGATSIHYGCPAAYAHAYGL